MNPHTAKLVAVTPEPEKLMAYIARVSNPANQDNPDYAKLLRYCMKHGHWSVFEHASMTVEIHTTRSIAAQILRHRSFCYQEFSQRYAAVTDFPVIPELRRQDLKNRQSSHDDLPSGQVGVLQMRIGSHFSEAHDLYEDMLAQGVAKECAREVLPLATPTTIYMTGNCRSWIHYIQLRTTPGTQKEHRKVAESIREIFEAAFPTVAEAMRAEGGDK